MHRVLVFLFFACIAAHAQSYLVAPFANRSADPQLDWVGESVSEAIREAFADLNLPVVSRELRVDTIKRLSLRSGHGISLASWIKVSEQTSANRLILGEIHFTPAEPPPPPPAPAATSPDAKPDPDRPPPPAPATTPPAPPTTRGALRLVTRVMDATRPVQLAEFSQSGPIEDLAALEAAISWRLLQFAKAPRLPDLQEFRRQRPNVKLNALESYIRGLMATSSDAKHRYFTQAARFDPSFANPRYYLGRMHFKAENYREAATWLDKISPSFRDYVHARFMLGLSRFELSEFEESRAAFEDVAAKVPVPELWNNLGAAQARLGMPQARENLQKALNAKPSDPDYHFNTGYILWRQGEFSVAAERFRAVLDRLPNDDDAIYLLGRCLKSSGPRNGDLRTEGLLRLKDTYEEVK
ncbi:MAG: tetratricopeptide repeat protein [Bryobacterales bacterium]|nr:tetratricopeptide repeat protein [Bryobacterales bacterium]